MQQNNKTLLVSGASSSDLTGKSCSPNLVHWTYDTYALSSGVARAVVESGGKSWFLLTADYAFGHAMEADIKSVVQKAGGKVLGGVRTPINTQDFSSFLLQAQSSKAEIIALINAGGDTINSIKQAVEFGIPQGGPARGRDGAVSQRRAFARLEDRAGAAVHRSLLLGSE